MIGKVFNNREHLWYPPILATILNGIYIISTNFSEPDNFSWIFLFKTIIQFYAYLFFASIADHLVDKQSITNTRLNHFLTFFLGLIGSWVFGILLYVAVKQFFIVYYQQNDSIGSSHILINTLSIIVGYVLIYCIYLVGKSYRKKMEVERENAAFEKEKLQLSYELLYSKLEPHFLFNNLNTLHSLIVAKEDAAEQFVLSLSKIMRYSFQSQSRDTATLKEELEIFEHYLVILKERVGEFLTHTEIPHVNNNKQLIPMSLPNLLENIVKHNEISQDKPLHIELAVAADHFELKNTFNPKANKEEDREGGLKLLNNMYQLRTGMGLKYRNEKDLFSVKIPFIE